MIKKVAKPRHITFSETLDRFLRTKRDFAVRPFGFAEERWAGQRISSGSKEATRTQEHKRLIHDVSEGVKGIEFAAEEMAKVIRGWMAQDA